jgi:hypothetical protein
MHLVDFVDSFLTDPKHPCKLSSPCFENVRRFAQAVEDAGEGRVTFALHDPEACAVTFERIDSDLKTFVVNFYEDRIEFMDDRDLDRIDEGDYADVGAITYDEALSRFLN